MKVSRQWTTAMTQKAIDFEVKWMFNSQTRGLIFEIYICYFRDLYFLSCASAYSTEWQWGCLANYMPFRTCAPFWGVFGLHMVDRASWGESFFLGSINFPGQEWDIQPSVFMDGSSHLWRLHQFEAMVCALLWKQTLGGFPSSPQ